MERLRKVVRGLRLETMQELGVRLEPMQKEPCLELMQMELQRWELLTEHWFLHPLQDTLLDLVQFQAFRISDLRTPEPQCNCRQTDRLPATNCDWDVARKFLHFGTGCCRDLHKEFCLSL